MIVKPEKSSKSDVSRVPSPYPYLIPGYSALAWAEGQKDLEDAEVRLLKFYWYQVVTLENDPLMIAIANDAIMKAEQSSHIRILEGEALET